jgi:predicted NUDIX family NTP pyrophosphohydrolase
MPKTSAGLLLFKRGPSASGLLVLLVHPGGPFWAMKDIGSWSIPKGEAEPDEDLVAVARREFEEETGIAAPREGLVALGEIKQAGGKRVHAFAVEGDLDPASIRSNTFQIEWPPASGRRRSFPEIDRVEWFDLGLARHKINPAQRAFIERLVRAIGSSPTRPD